MIGINDQILVQLKKGMITEGYETSALAIDVAENTIPELDLGVPVIDLPALAVDTPVVNLSGIQTETQPPIFNPPPIQRLSPRGETVTELPGLDIPAASRHRRRWSMFPQ